MMSFLRDTVKTHGDSEITLCLRTPPIFHRNNYFLDAQKHVFRTPFVFGHPFFSPK